MYDGGGVCLNCRVRIISFYFFFWSWESHKYPQGVIVGVNNVVIWRHKMVGALNCFKPHILSSILTASEQTVKDCLHGGFICCAINNSMKTFFKDENILLGQVLSLLPSFLPHSGSHNIYFVFVMYCMFTGLIVLQTHHRNPDISNYSIQWKL